MKYILILLALTSCSTMKSGAIGFAKMYAVGAASQPQLTYNTKVNQEKIYNASDCIGAIVGDKCHGKILAPSGPIATCYGKMLGGQCTGPMF